MTADAGRRHLSLLAGTLISLSFLSFAAVAGEVAEKAAEAEAQLSAGDAEGGFEALAAAVESFWDAAPLTLREAYFVADANGNGIAQQRPDGPFKSGETARIYLEPLGYGFGDEDGALTIALSTGIEIRTPGGLVLAKTEDFGHLEWKGLVRNRTFNGRIGVGLPDLKAGDYELILSLADKATGKTGSVTLPFTIAAE